MKETCLISFGDSATYRLPGIESTGRDMKEIEGDVKSYLKAKFPQLVAMPYYSKMTVKKVKEEEGKKYPEFSVSALETIEKTLASEVADERSIKELNLDAPYSDI